MVPFGAWPANAAMLGETPGVVERLEVRALELANEERICRGYSTLTHDAALARAARRHAEAMRDRGFVGHISPARRWRTIGRRLAMAGITDAVYGENVGLYGTNRASATLSSLVSELHRRLMRSPVHRDNLLNPQFNTAGIGIAIGEAFTEEEPEIPLNAIWISQDFVARRLELSLPRTTLTPMGYEVILDGTSPAGSRLWICAHSNHDAETLVVAAATDGGQFSERLALPTGDGEYRLELRLGHDSETAITANTIVIDTTARPHECVRSGLYDK